MDTNQSPLNNPPVLYNHLLEQYGVLLNFRIARKVKNINLKKIKVPNKKRPSKQEKLQAFIEQLTKETNEEIQRGKIPGLIASESDTTQSIHDVISDTKMLELNVMSGIFANDLVAKKLSKDEVCYTVLNLLTLLGLIDEDFKEFHRKYNGMSQDDEEDDSDEDESEF